MEEALGEGGKLQSHGQAKDERQKNHFPRSMPEAGGTAPELTAQETLLGWSLQAAQHRSAVKTDIPVRY